MAPVMESLAKQQFAAVTAARWASQMHALKTMQGKLELISKIAIFGFYGLFGLGFGTVAAIIAYIAVTRDKAEFIAGMIWFLFGFWQLFPILRAGYTNTFDASTLLRFPVTYPTYFLLRCFYSALEPVAVVAVLGMTGITFGVTVAAPALLPWCALIMLLIVVLNILTTQLVLSWVERWLAQRRSREILGMLFFLFVIGIQFIGPMAKKLERRGTTQMTRETAVRILTAERILPPGLAGYALSNAHRNDMTQAAIAVGGLAFYGIGLGLLLDLRLRKQYRGENLSETAVRRKTGVDRTLRIGWNIPGLSTNLAGMVEKELRYLIRSGPMLLSFIMPLVVLLVFGGASGSRLPTQYSLMTFPLVAAYSLLILTNVVYNTFGGDHAGVQFYFMSPVPLRRVILAKNMVHAAIFVTELAVLWVAVRYLRTPPVWWVTAATVAAVPFALGLEFSVGNMVSIIWPKKTEFQIMGRQRTPQVSALLALVVHAVVVVSSGIVFVATIRYGTKIVLPAFVLMDAGAIALYVFMLAKAEQLALKRRETMFEALCRE